MAAPATTVVVPSRDRPEKLARCLEALARARGHVEFDVVVCDSSGPEHRPAAAAACAAHPFVRHVGHDLVGPCAARNLGAQEAGGELVVYVDDDVYVEPEAVAALVEAHEREPGDVVVAGTLDWGDHWSGPHVMRPIGYARPARAGERPEWFISALLCVRREVVLACPWDEQRRYYDDRMMFLLWQRHGVRPVFCPTARARHDDDRKSYPLAQERHRIYANLFDALFVRRSARWAASYLVLGLAASGRRFARTPAGAAGLMAEWLRGCTRFLLDLPRLRERAR